MKKLLIFVFAIVAFAACEQAPIEEQSAIRQDIPDTITVGFEDDDTRIQLNEAQKTVWNAGDEVSVFYKSYDNLKFEFEGNTGDRNGTLKRVGGQHNGQTMDDVIVVYPYSEEYMITLSEGCVNAQIPSTQTYLKDSYGVGDNLMIARSSFNQFCLKSVCGWLKIQLTGDGEVIERITFRGNDDEQVAGLVYVDATTAEVTLATAKHNSDDNSQLDGTLVHDDSIYTEVVLDCGEGVILGAEATTFYIALPPQTFEQGFTVDVECEGYEPMTLETTTATTIERNTIKPMNSIKFEADENTGSTDSDVANNEIRYTATAKIEANSYNPWIFETFGANITAHEWDSTTGEGVITFDGNVTTIGDYAFEDCDSLTSVTIPDSVTTIGFEAFENCDRLTSVTIGDGVTVIGDWAFSGCDSLTSVTIGDGVTTIGVYAFYECSSLTEFNGKFASEDGRCLIVDGVLYSFAPYGLTEYAIPNSVTTIGYYAFYNCHSLTSITIPDSVTTIGWCAFYGCSSLTSVTIPDSVTWIGEGVFKNCYSLTSVTIPDSVTTIGDEAFYECYSLTSVTIPDGVTTIGYAAFAFCSSLTSITIPNSVTTIGDSAFSGCDSMTSITIPNSVTTIGDSAFSGCDSLTSVTIGDSVTTIGEYAFFDCYSLTSVTIGDSVTSIGVYAFSGCSSLTSVTIGDSVTSIGEYTFESCNSLTSVTIGDSVTSIGNFAFYYCSSLTSVTIPDSVTTIGGCAFYYCSSLTSVTIPDSVTTIGDSAFYGCNSLTEFKGSGASSDGLCIINNKGVLLYFLGKALTEYIIPDGVTEIVDYAFYSCDSLTSVTIPDSVTSIGDYAFQDCDSLTSVTIGDSVTTIGEEAFADCYSLTEFNGKFASEDGRCLIIDGVLTSFAPYGLTEYAIPNSVTTIGEFAFSDYASLTSVTIPDSVTTIGSYAFSFCTSLTSVTIGDSVTTIGDVAFWYCTSLTSVFCKATTPPALGGYGVFDDNHSGRKIYVPTGSVNAYKSATYWSNYASVIIGYDF